MDGWHDFFVAMAGAAVAFAGLVLVSVSINLDRIIEQPGLVGRSSGPLIVLFTLFVASSTMLIPDQRSWFYGIELLAIALVFALVIGSVLRRQRTASRSLEQQGRIPAHSFHARVALCAVTALFLLAGGLMLLGEDARGLYVLVPAIFAGFLFSFLEAWVLLVEIDR